MPLAFDPSVGSGLAGDALRGARAEHVLHATGAAVALFRLLPHHVSRLDDSTVLVPYLLALWLVVAGLVLHEDARGLRIYRYVVGPGRLGAVLDRLLPSLGPEQGAMHPSVLRAWLLRAADGLRASEPALLTAALSDMYEVAGAVDDDETAEDALEAAVLPGCWTAPSYSDIASSDGRLAALPELELVLWPRILAVSRIGNASGFRALDRLAIRALPERERKEHLDMATDAESACVTAAWLATVLPSPIETTDFTARRAHGGASFFRWRRSCSALTT